MMTSTIRKFGVGVASLAMVAGMAAPAVAFDPSPFYNINKLRVAGADRVATAIDFAQKAFKDVAAFGGKPGERVVYLAGYDAPADSAAAGSLAAPIFLVKADGSSNEDVAKAIGAMNVNQIIALGGDKAVPDSVLSGVATAAGAIPTGRLTGADRYETSVAIAERWSDINSQFTPDKVVLANGMTLVDALTAGTLGWPILLADEQGKLPQSVIDYLNKVKPLDYIAVGGEKVMPKATVDTAQAASLSTDNLSTDDSLPELRRKKERWESDIKNIYRPEAIKAAGLARTAKLQSDAQTNAVDSAVNDLSSAVTNAIALNAGKPVSQQLPGEGKSWADYLNAPTGDGATNVAQKKAALVSAIQTAYAPQANAFDLDLAGIKKYLTVNRNGVALNVTELKKEFVNGDVEAANNVVVKYYRTTPKNANLLSGNALANAVMGDNKVLKSEVPANNVYQIQGVIDKIAELTSGTLASAESSLRALNLKIAGVQDQVAGKSYWRLAGKDRYGTAAAISARKANVPGLARDGEGKAARLGKIYLVNGSAFADATVAGASSAPILLINANGVTIPEVTNKEIIRIAKDYRNKHNVTAEVWAVGGKKVVSDDALSSANATALIAQREEDNTAAKPSLTVEHASMVIKPTDATGIHNKIMMENLVVTPGSAPTDFTVDGVAVSVRNNKIVPSWDSAAKDVKVVTTGADNGTYTIGFKVDGKDVSFTVVVAAPVTAPTYTDMSASVARDESEVALFKISNWNVLAGEGVKPTPESFDITYAAGDSNGEDPAGNAEVTKITVEGNTATVFGKLKAAYGASKTFKVSLKAKATSTHPAQDSAAQTTDITAAN